jgi:hypothetical protein
MIVLLAPPAARWFRAFAALGGERSLRSDPM